ncbi:hypothetical protein KL918_001455 [Ogataea parapolymorpha]|nr:hypothetical protein KL918_001455 [Ogataea parapolymorpha]KAG7870551.1 hypothetical protein KL916_004893 [Ogataea parapolymorpha]
MQLLSIQSHVAHGYVGNKAATFPLQMLGWNVDVLNTVNFSNHTGYGSVHGEVVAGDKLAEIYAGLCDINVQYDALLTGYIHGASSLAAVGQMCKAVKRSRRDSCVSTAGAQRPRGRDHAEPAGTRAAAGLQDHQPRRPATRPGHLAHRTSDQARGDLIAVSERTAARFRVQRLFLLLCLFQGRRRANSVRNPQIGLVLHRRRRPLFCAAAGQAVQTSGRGAGDEPGAERDVTRAGQNAADVRRKAWRDGAGQARRRHIHEGVRAAHRRVQRPVPPGAD